MKTEDLAAKLGTPNLLPEVLRNLKCSASASHFQKYWTNVWDYNCAGLFVISDDDYVPVKLSLDRLTGRAAGYNPVELAGEEGCSRQVGESSVILLPRTTWLGFEAADKQKTGTVVHEITHVEDSIINGAVLRQRALFGVWQEFFAETVAARFYDPDLRSKDLHAGMHMVAQKILGFHAGLDHFGRLMGALNGWGLQTHDVEDIFGTFGRYWQAAAVSSYPVLRNWAETERRPHIEVLEKTLGPLFG